MGINRTFLVTCTILVENLNELYIFTFFSLILFAKSVLSFSPCVCECVYVYYVRVCVIHKHHIDINSFLSDFLKISLD